MHDTGSSSTTSAMQAQYPCMQDKAADSVKGQPSEIGDVGKLRLSHSAPASRAAQVMEALAAGRTCTDAEIRQHAMDCAHLMERAYARFQQFGDDTGRDEAIVWDMRRKDALKALSPAWRAAREAAIQADIAAGGHLDARAQLARGA